MSLDPTYPFVPVVNFLGAFLVLIPLPWQLQSWNTGICMTMIWTCIGCLIRGVNSVAWKDNVEDSAPLWCDICTWLVHKFSDKFLLTYLSRHSNSVTPHGWWLGRHTSGFLLNRTTPLQNFEDERSSYNETRGWGLSCAYEYEEISTNTPLCVSYRNGRNFSLTCHYALDCRFSSWYCVRMTIL